MFQHLMQKSTWNFCFPKQATTPKCNITLHLTLSPRWLVVTLKLRPCERQNFLNFLFSQILEYFGYRSLEIFGKYPVFLNSQKFCKNSSKNLVFEAKTGVSEHSEFTEYSEFVLFRTFRKLWKNYVIIEFWKSRKTRSYSNIS